MCRYTYRNNNITRNLKVSRNDSGNLDDDKTFFTSIWRNGTFDECHSCIKISFAL